MYKYLILLSSFLLILPLHAEILEFSTQNFQDTDGLIKHIPDIETFPSAKQAYEDMVKQAHEQIFYQYNVTACQKLGVSLQPKNIDDSIAQCAKQYGEQCQHMKEQCLQLAEKFERAGKGNTASANKQIDTCLKRTKDCRQGMNDMLVIPFTEQTKIMGKWIADFYTQNRKLAQPYSGKLYSQDKTHLLIIENGVQQAAYPIQEFPHYEFHTGDGHFETFKVYIKDGNFYTLTGTKEHEADKPFSGTIILDETHQKGEFIYTLQKYTNGVADGPVYQEKKKIVEPTEDYKPIIYLYPREEAEVTVKVGHPEKLTHTYPKYKDGWHVLANPNGDLTDLKTGRNLYALYWEGQNTTTKEITEGFVVKGSDTISFLEEKLAQLGLNEREAEEFIIYWLPKLENHPYNLIRFESLEQQNANMPLNITPKPDTLIRVLMEYKPLKDKIDLPEQTLSPTPTRTGFTVVEWGGTELNEKD